MSLKLVGIGIMTGVLAYTYFFEKPEFQVCWLHVLHYYVLVQSYMTYPNYRDLSRQPNDDYSFEQHTKRALLYGVLQRKHDSCHQSCSGTKKQVSEPQHSNGKDLLVNCNNYRNTRRLRSSDQLEHANSVRIIGGGVHACSCRAPTGFNSSSLWWLPNESPCSSAFSPAMDVVTMLWHRCDYRTPLSHMF
jgi:hypothetical protein